MDEIRQTLQWRAGDTEYGLIRTAEGWSFIAPEGTVSLTTEALSALARALVLAQAAGSGHSAAPPPTGPPRSRAGKPWTSGEDAELCDEHASGMSQRAMAKLHDRTPGAITARLVHLGLIESRGPLRFRGTDRPNDAR